MDLPPQGEGRHIRPLLRRGDRTYYFRLAAYRLLFGKRVGGERDEQYVNLDFGHSKTLAALDRDLRYALLPLTLDVEHAARTKLVRIATERENEDGYSIAADCMAGNDAVRSSLDFLAKLIDSWF